MLWCIVWLALVSDSPAEHRRIKHIEKAYIIQSLRGEMKAHRSKVRKLNLSSLQLHEQEITWNLVFFSANILYLSPIALGRLPDSKTQVPP